MNVESLVHTSVEDCRSTLMCMLSKDPAEAARLIDNAIAYMDQHLIEQCSKRKAMAVIKRKAIRLCNDSR